MLISYEFPSMIGGEGMYTYGLEKALSDIGHVITADIGGPTERRTAFISTYDFCRDAKKDILKYIFKYMFPPMVDVKKKNRLTYL